MRFTCSANSVVHVVDCCWSFGGCLLLLFFGGGGGGSIVIRQVSIEVKIKLCVTKRLTTIKSTTGQRSSRLPLSLYASRCLLATLTTFRLVPIPIIITLLSWITQFQCAECSYSAKQSANAEMYFSMCMLCPFKYGKRLFLQPTKIECIYSDQQLWVSSRNPHGQQHVDKGHLWTWNSSGI